MWEVLAYLSICGVFALLISAVSALVWGPGATRNLSRRLTIAEDRVEDINQRITGEVKKRANQASQESRRAKRTEADVIAEAHEHALDGDAPPAGADGRVRTTGVFPVKRR